MDDAGTVRPRHTLGGCSSETPHPLPRTVWGETWRLLLALAVGGFVFGAVLIEGEQPGKPAPGSAWRSSRWSSGSWRSLLLPLRRRYPLPVAAARPF